MWLAKLKSTWSKVLAGGAVVLGGSALVGGVAQADLAQYHSCGTTPEREGGVASRVDEVIVTIVGEHIQVSQDGSSFEELRLGETPEAAYLKRLMRNAGAGGQPFSVPIGSMIVASGGGSAKGGKPKDSDGK